MSEDLEKWLYLLIIDYKRRKVCECTKNTYILDYKNRLVYCADCGAIVDPFEALLNMAKDADRIHAQLMSFAKLAQEERARYVRFKGVNNVTAQHRRGMIPLCPECGKPIDPADIKYYVKGKGR